METVDSPEPTAEPTETQQRGNVPEIPVEEFAAIWLDESGPEDHGSVSSFRPTQLQASIGSTLTEESYGLVAYDDLNYEPGDVPQTFIQWMAAPVLSSIKVDLIPETTSSEEVISVLEENAYEHSRDVADYSVYRNPAADAVYGVGPDCVVIGVNYSNPSRVARNSQHAEDVVDHIKERSQADPGYSDSMEDGIRALEIHDSLDIWEYDSDAADFVDGLDPQYQPDVGLTSVDLDTEVKYGVWVFQDQNLAEWVHADLQEGGSRYEWERIDQTDNVITAAGEATIKRTLNEPSSSLAFPLI